MICLHIAFLLAFHIVPNKKVKVGYPWDSIPSMQALAGVLPNILIIAQLANMKRKQLDSKSNIESGLKDELDRRDIKEGGYHVSVMMKSMNEYCQSIMKELNKMTEKQNSHK